MHGTNYVSFRRSEDIVTSCPEWNEQAGSRIFQKKKKWHTHKKDCSQKNVLFFLEGFSVAMPIVHTRLSGNTAVMWCYGRALEKAPER